LNWQLFFRRCQKSLLTEKLDFRAGARTSTISSLTALNTSTPLRWKIRLHQIPASRPVQLKMALNLHQRTREHMARDAPAVVFIRIETSWLTSSAKWFAKQEESKSRSLQCCVELERRKKCQILYRLQCHACIDCETTEKSILSTYSQLQSKGGNI
jgi:hypothetical protein